MGELPTGTVTFVFTDIEGSTVLLDRLGDGYGEVLFAITRCCVGCGSRTAGSR